MKTSRYVFVVALGVVVLLSASSLRADSYTTYSLSSGQWTCISGPCGSTSWAIQSGSTVTVDNTSMMSTDADITVDESTLAGTLAIEQFTGAANVENVPSQFMWTSPDGTFLEFSMGGGSGQVISGQMYWTGSFALAPVVVATPEPETALLLGVALAGLAAVGLFRKMLP